MSSSPTQIPKLKTEKLNFNSGSSGALDALYTSPAGPQSGNTPNATPRSSGSNPWKTERDRRDAKRMIPYLAAALLLPLSVSNIYFSLFYDQDGSPAETANASNALFHIGYFVVVALGLAVLADRFPGEMLIVAVFVIGLCNEVFDVGMNKAAYAAVMHGVAWILVAALLGAISGALCKAKDIIDGRFRKEYSFTERLYLMIPYVVGVWVGHIVMAGWGGLFTVFSSIFFLEAVVGYGLFALKLLRYQGLSSNGKGDLLSVFRTLANASFGKVLFGGLIFSFVFFYLLAPSWSSLSARLPHTLLSAVCIITEVTTYDAVV
jgi:hypothetical protein